MSKVKNSDIKKILGSSSSKRTSQQKQFSITQQVKSFVKKYRAADTEKRLDVIMAMLVLLASKFENESGLISAATQLAEKIKKQKAT